MTAAATDFLHKLRHDTAPFHRSIEQLPLSSLLLSKEVTLQHYRHYLIVLFGFVKEFESSVYPQVAHVIDDLDTRKKFDLLCRDLTSLGIQPETIEVFDDGFFKQHETVAGALGCMYVLEGSTLGGQLISRHLMEMLEASVAGSLSYLSNYSVKTGSMWKKFLDIFCELTVKNGHQEEAIKSAIKTFELLENWMLKHSITRLEV